MAKELSLYDKKLMELKKFIPFLDNMEDRLKSASGDKIGVQLTKIQGLKNLIKGDKRMKMENLLKCEQVLTKLYEKTMEKIASNQNTKDTAVEENSQDTCSSETSVGDKKDESEFKKEEEVKQKLNLNFYKEHCDVEAEEPKTETKKDVVDGDICEKKTPSPEEPGASEDRAVACAPVTAEVLPTPEIPIIPTSPVRSEEIKIDTSNLPNQSKTVSTKSTKKIITTDAVKCTVISNSNLPSGKHIPTILNRQPTKPNSTATTVNNKLTDLDMRTSFSSIDLRTDLDMRTPFSDIDLRFNNVFINDPSSASFNPVSANTATSAAVETQTPKAPENKSVPFFNSIPVLLGRNSTTPHISAPSNNFMLPTNNVLGSNFPIYNSDYDMRPMQTNSMPSTDIKTLSEFNILSLSEVRSDNLYVPASSSLTTDSSTTDTTTSLEIKRDVFEVNSRNKEPALFENRPTQLESSPLIHIKSDVSTGSSQHPPSHLEKSSQVHESETSPDLSQLHPSHEEPSSLVLDKSVVKFCEDGLEIVNKFPNNSKVEEKKKNDPEQKQLKSVVKVFTRVLVSPPRDSSHNHRSSSSRKRYSRSTSPRRRRSRSRESPRRRRSRSRDSPRRRQSRSRDSPRRRQSRSRDSPRRRRSRSRESPRRRRSRSRSCDRYKSSKYKSYNKEEKHYLPYNTSKEKYKDIAESQRRGIREKSRSKSSQRSKSREESSHKKNKDPQTNKKEIKLLGKKIYEILELNELKRKREKLMQELQEESFLIPEKSPEPPPTHKGEREDGELGASDEEVDMLYSDLVEDETKKKTEKQKAKSPEPAPTKSSNIASSLMKLNKILKDQSFKQEILNVKSTTLETVTESFTVSRTLHTSREALFKTMADIITSEIVPVEKKQIDNEKITEAKTPALKLDSTKKTDSQDPLISTPGANTGDSGKSNETVSLKSHQGLEGITQSSSELLVKSVDSSLQDDILKALASETGSDIKISNDKKEENAKETINKTAKDLSSIKSRRISLETYKEKHSISVKCEDLILENHKKYEDIVKSIFSPKELAKFEPILPKQTEQHLALDVATKTGVPLTKLSRNNTIKGIENIDKDNKVQALNKSCDLGSQNLGGMTPLPPWATPVNRQFEFQPKKHVYSNILSFSSNSILSPEQEDNVIDTTKRGILNSAYDIPKSLTSLGLGSPNSFPSSRLPDNGNSVKPFINNDGIFSPRSGFETPDISQQSRQNFPQSREASIPPSPRFDGNLSSSIKENSFACPSYNPYDTRPKPSETPHRNNPKDCPNWSNYGRSFSNEQDFHETNNYGSSTPNSESSYYGARSPFPSGVRDNPGSYTPLRDTWSNSDAWGRSDSWNPYNQKTIDRNIERFTPARDYDNQNHWIPDSRMSVGRDCDNIYERDTLGNQTPRMDYDSQWTNDQFSSLRDRNMERRNFEREKSISRQTPSNNFDIERSVGRQTPSRNFERERSVGRQTPSRNFERERSVGRQTPSRNFDRERSIGRQTPSRDFDYKNSEYNVGRQFRNDGEAYYNERFQRGPSAVRLDYQPVDSTYNMVNKFERARSVGRSVCDSNLDTQKKYSDQADHYSFRNHNFEITNKFARSRSVGRSLYETKLESRAKSVGPRSQCVNNSMFPAYNGNSTFKLEKRIDNNLSEFQCKVKRSQSLSREYTIERASFPETKHDYSNKKSESITKPMQKAIELIEKSKKSRDPRLNKDRQSREISRSSKDPRLKKFDKKNEKDDLVYDTERHKDKNRSSNSSNVQNSDKTKSNHSAKEGRSLIKDNNMGSAHKRSSSSTSTNDKNYRPKNKAHTFTKDERRDSSSRDRKETKSDLNKRDDSKLSIRSEHRNQREKISHFKIPKIKKVESDSEISNKQSETKTIEIKNESLETQESHIKGKDVSDVSKKECQPAKVRKESLKRGQGGEKLDSVSNVSSKVTKEILKTKNKKNTDKKAKSKSRSQADKFSIIDAYSTSEQDDNSDSEILKLPSKTTSTPKTRLVVEYSSSDENDSMTSSIRAQKTNYDKQFDELLNNETKVESNLSELEALTVKNLEKKTSSPITAEFKVANDENPQINMKMQKTKQTKTRNKRNESSVESISDKKERELKLKQDIDKVTIDPHSIHTTVSVTTINDDLQTTLGIDDQDDIEPSSKSLNDLPQHEIEVEKQSDSEKSNIELDSPIKSRLRRRVREEIQTSKATRASERKIQTPKTIGAKKNENKVNQKSGETFAESGSDDKKTEQSTLSVTNDVIDNNGSKQQETNPVLKTNDEYSCQSNVVDSSNIDEVSKSVETDNTKELDVTYQSTSKDIELNKKDNQSDITNLVEILKNKDKMMQILAMLSNDGEEISTKIKKRLELLAEIDSDEEDNCSKPKVKHSTVDIDASKSKESHSTTDIDALKNKEILDTVDIDASKSKKSHSTTDIDASKSKESHSTTDIDALQSKESHSTADIDISKSKESNTKADMDLSKNKELDSKSDIDASKSEDVQYLGSQEAVVTSQNVSCLDNALPEGERKKPLDNDSIEKESLGNEKCETSDNLNSLGDNDKIQSTNNSLETGFVGIDASKELSKDSENGKIYENISVDPFNINPNKKDLPSQTVNNVNSDHENQIVDVSEVVNSDRLDETNQPVVESNDTTLSHERNEEDPNKKPSKKKNKGSRELQMLHEYNFDMFIGADVLKATGVRSCTISHLENSLTPTPKNNEPVLKAAKPPGTKNKPTNTKINKPSKIKQKKTVKSVSNKSKDGDSLLPRVVVEKTNIPKVSTTKDVYDYSDDNSVVEDYQFIKQKPCPKSKKLLVNTGDVPNSSELNVTNEPDIAELPSQISKAKKKKSKKKRNSWQSGIIKKKKKGNLSLAKDSNYCEVDYCFKEKIKEYKCKLCNYTGQYIVKHYKTQHPHAEVMISRLSPDQAKQASEEGIKETKNKTPKIKMYRCRFCMRLFRVKNLRSIFDHIVFCHTGEYKKECSLCSTKDSKKCVSVCNKSSTLPPADDFIDCVTGYMCGLCSYTQLSHENLKTHIWLRHFSEECELKEINLTMQNARRRVLKDGLEVAKTEVVVKRSKHRPAAALEPEIVLTPRLRARKIVSPPKTTKSKSLPPKRKEITPQKKSDKLESENNKSNQDLGGEEVIPNSTETIREVVDLPLPQPSPLLSESGIFHSSSNLGEANIKQEIHEEQFLEDTTPDMVNIKTEYPCDNNELDKGVIKVGLIQTKDIGDKTEYSCFIKDCKFVSFYLLIFMSHVDSHNADWDGFCCVCNKNINSNANIQFKYDMALQHLLSVHSKGDQHMGQDKTVKIKQEVIDDSEEFSSSQPKPSEENTNLTTTTMNDRKPLPEHTQEDDFFERSLENLPGFLPKINVRSLEHLLDNNDPRTGSANEPASLIPIMSPDSQSMSDTIPSHTEANTNSNINTFNDSNAPGLCQLRIENVVSLNPNSSSPFADNSPEIGSKALSSRPEQKNESQSNRKICISKVDTTKGTTTSKTILPYYPISKLLFKCVECIFKTDEMDEFIAHFSVRDHSAICKCCYCSFVCPDPKVLSHHILEEHGPSRYNCMLCEYRAAVPLLVATHALAFHKVKLLTVDEIEPHKSIQDGDMIKGILPKNQCVSPYICKYKCGYPLKACDSKFYASNAFGRHIVKKHGVSANLECQICLGKHFVTKSLLCHMKNIHKWKLLTCSYCAVAFDTKAEALGHLIVRHSGRRPLLYLRLDNSSKGNLQVEEDKVVLLNLDKGEFYRNSSQTSPMKNNPSQLTSKELSIILETENKQKRLSGVEISSSASVSTSGGHGPSADILLDQTVPDQSLLPANNSKDPPTQDSGTESTPTERATQDDDDESSDIIVVDSDDESVSSVPKGLKRKSLDDALSLAEPDKSTHKIQQKVSTQLNKPFSSFSGVSLNTIMKNTGVAYYELFRCGNATCTYSALNSNDFRDHLIICEHAKEFDMLSCYHCSKEFRTAVRLLDHIRSHGTHRYQCSVCHYCSYGNVTVMQHMRKVHKSTSIITIPLKPLKNDYDKDFFICKGNSSKKKPGPKSRVSVDHSTPPPPPPAPATLVRANSPSKKNTFGPDEINLLPVNPILTEDIYCKVCNFATKVRSNLLRHLQMHANEIAVPSVAPINPVPHLQSNEMHFDKMTNLALSSNINKPKGKNVGKKMDKRCEDSGKHPKYVPEKERFVCGSLGCKYISVDELMLRLHWETLHNGERIFHCAHCKEDVSVGNQYLSTGAIASHLRLHEDTLYGCNQCSFIHPLRRQVEKHSVEVHGKDYSICIRELLKSLPSESHHQPSETATADDKGWQCSLCPTKCQTKDAIAAHCKQSHQVTHQYKCSMCDFGCSIKQLKPHFKKHPNAAPKILTMFNKADEVDQSVVDNFPIWWGERKRPSTFIEEKSASAPQITNTSTLADQPSSSKLFKMNSEDSESSDKVDPSSGVLPTYTCVQPEGDNYKCPFCFKFTSPSYAKMHSHLCEELNYRNWMCVTCGYKSFSSQNILTHSKLNHGVAQTKLLKGNPGLEFWIDGLFRVQDQMIEKFRIDKNLYITSEPVKESTLIILDEPPKIAEKDPGKKMYKCPHCDYQSVHPINQHIKRHWKVKPLGCGHCSKSFVKLIEVKSHWKQAHAGLEFLCVNNVLPTTPEIVPLTRPSLKRSFDSDGNTTSLEESLKSSKSLISIKTHMCLKCETHLSEDDVEDHTKTCKHDDKYPILPKKTIAFKCSICMQLTVNSATLRKHFDEEHPGMEINYVMHAVGKPKTKRILPKSNLPDLPATIDDKTNFMCCYCYNKFTSYSLYLQHHKSSHDDQLIRFEPLTLCDLSRSEEVKVCSKDKECCVVGCQYVAGNITELLSHIRSHYIVYKCHFCNTLFFLYKFYLNHSQTHLGMVCKVQDDFTSNTVVQDRLMKIVGLYKSRSLIAPNSDERSYIFEDNIQFEPFVTQIILPNSKQTARKSTTNLGQLDWRSSPSRATVDHQPEYSFYGTKPKPIDLKKITINVEFFGSQKTLSVEQLKAIENLFPKLKVQDVMKQEIKMCF